MSGCCPGPCAADKPPINPNYRRILWIALVANVIMFVVEVVGGFKADSVSLLADAVDFLGDAANYSLSLFVLVLAPVWRSRTALVKGLTMGGFGIFVLGKAAWSTAAGTIPEAVTMGAIGFLALLTNLAVAGLLFTYRNGDADMRSVWLCSRNDAIGNVAVMLAALGVLGTGTSWPDIVVAIIMGTLALTAAKTVIIHARSEINATRLAVEET